MSYQYDKKYDVLLKNENNMPLSARSKFDGSWIEIPNKAFKYEEYGKAFYFGKGCINRLELVSEEEANKILKNWKDYQKLVSDYKENEKEKLRSDIARLIFESFACSFKPYLFSKENLEKIKTSYKWLCFGNEYFLLELDEKDFKPPRVLLGNKDIGSFIIDVLFKFTDTVHTWEEISTSSAVIRALQNRFGIPVMLSKDNPGYKSIISNIHTFHPTVWYETTKEEKINILKENNFEYFNQNIWEIEL